MTKPDLQADEPGDSLLRGAGSAELATESNDAVVLRALLERARERLSFYEGFDRMIAENVRRSGELMLESLSIKEGLAAQTATREGQERVRLDEALTEMGSSLDSVTANLGLLAGQIRELRTSLGPAGVSGTAPGPAHSTTREAAPVVSPASTGTPVAAWDSPQVIDVIAHHITKAASALSLQQHLGSLESVIGVEAREFAGGVLRLQVTANRPLQREDLVTWTGGGALKVLQLQANVVEITPGEP